MNERISRYLNVQRIISVRYFVLFLEAVWDGVLGKEVSGPSVWA